jgi:hypothetical protein
MQNPRMPKHRCIHLFRCWHQEIVHKMRVLLLLAGFDVIDPHRHPFTLDGADRLTIHTFVSLC